MKRSFVIVVTVSFLLALVAASSVSPTRWEYARYSEGDTEAAWQAAAGGFTENSDDLRQTHVKVCERLGMKPGGQNSIDVLNAAGAQGWELVWTAGGPAASTTFLFKRPR